MLSTGPNTKNAAVCNSRLLSLARATKPRPRKTGLLASKLRVFNVPPQANGAQVYRWPEVASARRGQWQLAMAACRRSLIRDGCNISLQDLLADRRAKKAPVLHETQSRSNERPALVGMRVCCKVPIDPVFRKLVTLWPHHCKSGLLGGVAPMSAMWSGQAPRKAASAGDRVKIALCLDGHA